MADVEQDADIKVTRSRLMAAIAAGNADALTEVCNSIASEWASELSSEVAAARKAIELVRGHEDAVKALEREKAAALQLKEQIAEHTHTHMPKHTHIDVSCGSAAAKATLCGSCARHTHIHAHVHALMHACEHIFTHACAHRARMGGRSYGFCDCRSTTRSWSGATLSSSPTL